MVRTSSIILAAAFALAPVLAAPSPAPSAEGAALAQNVTSRSVDEAVTDLEARGVRGHVHRGHYHHGHHHHGHSHHRHPHRGYRHRHSHRRYRPRDIDTVDETLAARALSKPHKVGLKVGHGKVGLPRGHGHLHKVRAKGHHGKGRRGHGHHRGRGKRGHGHRHGKGRKGRTGKRHGSTRRYSSRRPRSNEEFEDEVIARDLNEVIELEARDPGNLESTIAEIVEREFMDDLELRDFVPYAEEIDTRAEFGPDDLEDLSARGEGVSLDELD